MLGALWPDPHVCVLLPRVQHTMRGRSQSRLYDVAQDRHARAPSSVCGGGAGTKN